MFIEFLQNELARRSRTNPGYSIRAFARTLKIHPATLAAVLGGKRPITPKTAQKLLDELEIKSEVKHQLLLSTMTSAKALSELGNYHILDNDTLSAVGSWEHFALLSLVKIRKTKHQISSFSRTLGISTGVVMDALKRLERLGLIQKQGSHWVRTERKLTTPNDVPNANVRKLNRQFIEQALISLENDSVDRRDITGMTMAVSSSKLKQAKTVIREFRRSLADLLETSNPDDVYRLNIQLFPLTKNGDLL